MNDNDIKDAEILSEKVYVEAAHGDRYTFDSLTPHEKQAALQILGELESSKHPKLYKTLWDLDYSYVPVGPEEFMNSEYYVGRITKDIYPQWKKDLVQVLTPENQIFEWICSGGIGTGKTTASQLAQMYKMYYLSCLRRPAEFFGLMETTIMVFMFFSLTMDKAETGVYANFKEMLERSPYFIDKFPTKKSTRRKWGTENGEQARDLQFPKGLRVMRGSKLSHALSLSVFSGILDEVNFRGKKTISEEEDMDSAVQIYEETASRIASRFQSKGITPGILCTVSSKKATTDFIDRHIEKVRSDPEMREHVYVSDYRVWDVKPSYKYSGKRFFIKIGGSSKTSYVISPGTEEDGFYRPLYEMGLKADRRFPDHHLPKNIMSIPEEYMGFFKRDFPRAMQNIAGLSTAPFGLLFDDPRVLVRGFSEDRTSPFGMEVLEIGVRGGQSIKSFFDWQAVTLHDGRNRMPKWYPRATRFAHVDLAKGRRDAVGVTMGCVSNIVWVEVLDVDGNVVRVPRPEIFIDFSIRIRAPQGDEVFFDEIRQFFGWLRDSMNYKLRLISYDQWNSIDSFQLLNKQGFDTRYVSVDRNTRAYMLLKETIVEDRLKCYRYLPLYEELMHLIYDQEHDRVDHPQFTPLGYRGAKDVADSLAGTIWNCTEALVNAKLPETSTTIHRPPSPPAADPGPDGLQHNDRFGYGDALTRRPYDPEITAVLPTNAQKAKIRG